MRAWLWRLWVSCTVLLVPVAAEACPVCARDSGGVGRTILLGAMIMMPFPLAGFVVRLVRRMERER
jgi:hypothetical protein